MAGDPAPMVESSMIELIGIVACLIACIGIPIQTAKVRSGAVPAKFKGTPAEYRAAWVKQVTTLMWVGLGLGAAMAGMAFIPNDTPYEWIAFAVCCGLWFFCLFFSSVVVVVLLC